MKVGLWHQRPGLKPAETLAGRISAIVKGAALCHVRIASAYVTVSGVRALLDCMPARQPESSHWLVGLDDAITQPGAIDLILKVPGANLRVVSHGGGQARFHPKVLLFGAKADRPDLAIVGSANLTGQALRRNGEAVAALTIVSSADRAIARDLWHELWRQGHALASGELDAYRDRYSSASRLRRDIEKTGAEKQDVQKASKDILEGDQAELDPSMADVCWIECGAVTAQGRELEIKGEQGLFFGVEPSGSKPVTLRFVVSSGATVYLRLKFQANSMWRVQMSSDVPEVAAGLRRKLPDGSLARSELAAVFKRLSHGAFGLRFIKIGSPRFNKLVSDSRQAGTVGRTRSGTDGRLYGWC